MEIEVSASGWSLVQRNNTECDVSEYDREASIKRRLWPKRGCRTIEREREIDLFSRK
jgi:hypothetical protein